MIELPACLLWVEDGGILFTDVAGVCRNEGALVDALHTFKKPAPFQRSVTGRLEGGGLMEEVMHVR